MNTHEREKRLKKPLSFCMGHLLTELQRLKRAESHLIWELENQTWLRVELTEIWEEIFNYYSGDPRGDQEWKTELILHFVKQVAL